MKNKNIFLLPTKEASSLYLENLVLKLSEYNEPNVDYAQNQFIYITINEKIKVDEWVTDGIKVMKASLKLVEAQGLINRREWSKIVLTNDKDLIEDGVQAVNNLFLSFYAENQPDYVKVMESYKQELNCCKEGCEFGCHSFFECKNVDESDLSKTYTLIFPQKK